MPRTLSTVMRQMANAPETTESLQALVTISHDQILDGPLRLVQDMQDMTSNGHVYTAFPFSVVLPEEGEEGLPRVSLTIDNVSQEIMASLKALPPTIAPLVTVDLVVASTPDVVEMSFPNLTLRNVSADQLQIEGELRMDEEDLLAFPQDTFTPKNFPAMFR